MGTPARSALSVCAPAMCWLHKTRFCQKLGQLLKVSRFLPRPQLGAYIYTIFTTCPSRGASRAGNEKSMRTAASACATSDLRARRASAGRSSRSRMWRRVLARARARQQHDARSTTALFACGRGLTTRAASYPRRTVRPHQVALKSTRHDAPNVPAQARSSSR